MKISINSLTISIPMLLEDSNGNLSLLVCLDFPIKTK